MEPELTSAQEKLLSRVRDEWLELCLTPRELDPREVSRHVAWLYGLAELPAPRVLCAEGPLAAVEIMNRHPSSRKDDVGWLLHARITGEVRDRLEEQVHRVAPIRERVETDVQTPLELQVRQTWVAAKKHPWFRLHNSRQIPWDMRGLGGHAHWTAFYDFCDRAGWPFPPLDPWRDYLRSGVWELVAFRDLAVAFGPPAMKSTPAGDPSPPFRHPQAGTGQGGDPPVRQPALEWPDGYRLYSLADGLVEGELVDHPENIQLERILYAPYEWRIALVELMGEERFLGLLLHAIRTAADVQECKRLIRFLGEERFLQLTGARVLDVDTDGAGMPRRLLSCEGNQGRRLCCLEVECPSTRKKYYLWVRPDLTRCSQAAAWTFRLKVSDYAPRVET